MKSKPNSGAAEALRAKRGEIASHIDSLKSDATKLRTRIGELRQRRDEIIDTHVSKDEYINLSLDWIDHFAEVAATRAATVFADQRRGVLSEQNKHATKMGRFLSRGRSPVNPLGFIVTADPYGKGNIDPAFLVLFLREPIKEAVRTHIMNRVDWPYDNVINDVTAARKEVAAIDAELESLNGELAALVDLGASFGATV